MKIKCLFMTSEYRGDHTAEICKLYDTIDGETVEQLVNRIGLQDASDSIQLKVMVEGK